MDGLRERAGTGIEFSGVGGKAMSAAGLVSLHLIDDLSIVGFSDIPRLLPRVIRYMRQTLSAIEAVSPDVLVLIDGPTYNGALARRARRADPTLHIVHYVLPPVWAWRFNRAPAMRNHIDSIMALMPFEPAMCQALGGPPCHYVGHPLIEEIGSLRPSPGEAERRLADPPLILAMLGSRSSEVRRLARIFGRAIGLVAERYGPLEIVVPTLPDLARQVTDQTASWPVPSRVVTSDAEKRAAIRAARAALTKCGTVTLELALGSVPMVAAYQVSAFEALVLRWLVRARTFSLPNLILQQNIVPEVVHDDFTPRRLAAELAPLLTDTAERRRQLDAFATLGQVMEVATRRPAQCAADHVLALCSMTRATS
jgi:lipid-A-disaccharide synthase